MISIDGHVVHSNTVESSWQHSNLKQEHRLKPRAGLGLFWPVEEIRKNPRTAITYKTCLSTECFQEILGLFLRGQKSPTRSETHLADCLYVQEVGFI